MSGSAKRGSSSGPARGACPIVGVGASAGGLKAFKAFFAAVPADSKLAYIVIQHLDPSRESRLPELLRPVSALPVTAAANGGTLQPGKVYVVPEGRVATVTDGVMHLRRRKDECEQAIDVLFTSLAVAPATACAVLLSGYGADGVQGLREIAATGGLTFVQDPSTAEHPEMPEAAIDAEAADVVGSPGEIAARLNELARRLGVVTPAPVVPVAETPADIEATEAILGYVERETGVDFRHYKPSTVRRRIGRRAMLRDADSLGEYLELLRNDAGETQALVADLLINVTRFFRDEDVFGALRSRVLPEILDGKPPGEPVRIWVPGCSTGEEVYSLLMTLIETLDGVDPKPQITVFGTDLSESALRRARAGVYAEDTCGSVSPERLDRFFHPVEHGYEVDRSLRDMCVFARQDVSRDTPFSRIDLISLRNVLIYMDQHLQRIVLAVAHYALVPGGFLVLGTSESPESDPRLFLTVDKQRHIYRRSDVPSRLPVEVTGAGRAFEPLPIPSVASPEEGFDLRAAAEAAALSAFAPPRAVVDADGRVVLFFGDTTPYLGHPEGRATLDIVEMAAPGLTLDLREVLSLSDETNAQAEREVAFLEDGRERRIAMVVEPLRVPGPRQYRLVAFQELPPAIPEGSAQEDVSRVYEAREERLRRELASLRGRLRFVVEEKDHTNEELRGANEEIQSSNEELQSLNEELETAKEELQSANEELITVNEELRQRNADLIGANDDLTDFFTSTAIPVVMLDRELRVRRFTPEAQRIAELGPSDEGRELARVRLRVHVPDLAELVKGVIEHLDTCDREVRDEAGRWYSMQIRPYRTSKDKVEGAVIGFFDIDDLRRPMQRVAKRARLGDALAAIDADIASTLRFDEIMQRALAQGVSALAADAGTIEMRGDGDWVVRYQSGMGGPAEVGLRLSDDEAPIAVRAERSRQPVRVADAALEPAVDVGFVRARDVRSVLAVPLVVRDAVIGCLLFHRLDVPRPFGGGDVDFARKLAASVSLAIDNSRLFTEERRATRSAESLAKVNEILLSATTPEELIARLVGEVSEVAGADKSLVIAVTGETLTVTHVRNVRDDLVGLPKSPSFFPGFALAAAERHPVLIEDTWNDPRTNNDFVVPHELRAFQLLPIVVDDETVAVVAFAWDEPHPFDDVDQAFAQRMSTAMSLAMRNARLHERERERTRLAEALSEIDAAVHSSLDFEEVVRRAVALGADALSADAGALAIHERSAFRVAFSYGFDEDITGAVLPDELEPHSLIALETRRTLAVEDATTDPRVIADHMAEYGVGAVLVVPLVVRGEAIGNLNYNYRDPRPFTRPETEFATQLGSSLSSAIENARLYEAEREAQQQATQGLEFAQVLLDSSAVFAEWTETRPMLEHLADVLLRSAAHSRVTIGLWDEERSELTTVVSKGEHPMPVTTTPLDRMSAAGREMIRKRERSLIDYAEVKDEGLREQIAKRKLRYALAVPIVARDRVLGTITVDAPGERQTFGEREIALVQSIADQAATALENANLHEAQRRTSEHLTDVLDSMTDGFVAVDREWRYTLVNPCAEGLLGRPAAQLLGRSMEELYPDMFGWPHYRAVMEQRTPETFEVWSEPLQKWLDVHAYPTGDGISILFADVSARKAAEEALRESEHRFGVLFETMEEGFALIEIISDEAGRPVDFRYLDMNPAFEKQTGLKAEDVLGRTANELFPGAENVWFERYGRVATTGVPEHFEEQFGPLNMWFDVGAYRTEPGRVAVVFFDVTARKQAESGTRQHATLMGAIGKVLQAALSSKTDEDLGRTCLDVAQDLTGSAFGFIDEIGDDGLLHDVALSDPGWERCVMTDKSGHAKTPAAFEVRGLYGKVFAEGRPFFTNAPAEDPASSGIPEGHPALTAFLGVPLFSEGRAFGTIALANREGGYTENEVGLVEALAPVIVEAFQRKRAERASAEAKALLDSHIDNSPLAVIEFDSEFRITRWSDEAEKMFGWTADEVLGKAMGEFRWVYEEDAASVADESRNLLTAANPRSLNVNRNYRKDGSVIWCEWYDSAVYDEEGAMVSVLSQVLEVTERKERERLDKALDTIRTAVGSTLDVGEIVHELATRAAETLRMDAQQIIMRSGSQWVVTDAHGMRSRVGRTFSDEDLPISVSAIAERRPLAEVDSGGRARKRQTAMRRFGVGSILIIPLLAQGRGIGIIGLGHSSAVSFSELEMYFATRLTSVATQALDNALAYERERAIADTLQEAVLAPPPSIPGVETGYLYRAASTEAAVGGDFYDVFELDGGKVGIVVGDVSGKGLEAARLTSLVRDGIRAYAFERDDPAWVIGRVNSLMYRTSPVEAFATVFFGVLDVLSGRLLYTAAGHPPAVACLKTQPRYLEDTPSAIVGAFDGATFSAAETKLEQDDILLLYTDGVIEARRDGEMYGDARLLDALSRLRETPIGLLPQGLLDDVLAFTGGGLRDDTVIVCVKRALAAESD